MSDIIFKISTKEEWLEAEKSGVYVGSPDDIRDGFIHFSTNEQLQGTLEKHFKGKVDLLLVSVAVEKLDQSALKWETSSNNEKFPHLYSQLNLDAVIEVKSIMEE